MAESVPEERIEYKDLGTKFKYFDYKDLPARKLSPRKHPEVYRPGKGWQPVDDTFDFYHRYVVVDEARIKEMIDRLENTGSTPAPGA